MIFRAWTSHGKCPHPTFQLTGSPTYLPTTNCRKTQLSIQSTDNGHVIGVYNTQNKNPTYVEQITMLIWKKVQIYHQLKLKIVRREWPNVQSHYIYIYWFIRCGEAKKCNDPQLPSSNCEKMGKIFVRCYYIFKLGNHVSVICKLIASKLPPCQTNVENVLIICGSLLWVKVH